jgi:hypothetical protein
VTAVAAVGRYPASGACLAAKRVLNQLLAHHPPRGVCREAERLSDLSEVPSHEISDGSARRRVRTVRTRDHVSTWLWIVIIVFAVITVGYFARGRPSR